MKKIYLLALTCAVVGTSVISSCKDTDEDLVNDLKGQMAQNDKNNQEQLAALRSKISDLNTQIAALATGEISKTEFDNIKTQLTAAQTTLTTLSASVSGLTSLQDSLQTLFANFQAKTVDVTGVVVQNVYNPAFGSFSLPLGVQSNVLASYFSTVTESSYFPVGLTAQQGLTPEELDVLGITPAPQNLVQSEFNLGKVYVTVNPSNEDFTGKTPLLVNSLGQDGYVALSPLEPCNEVLYFGYTRAASSVYTTNATLTLLTDADKLNMNFKQNASDLLSAVQYQRLNMRQIASNLYDLVNNLSQRRAIQLTNVNSTVMSDLSIASAVVMPLGFETVDVLFESFSLDRIKDFLKPITLDVNADINAKVTAQVSAIADIDVTVKDGDKVITGTGSGPVTGPANGTAIGTASSTITVDPMKEARLYIEQIEDYIHKIADTTAPAIVMKDASGLQFMSLDKNAPTVVGSNVKLMATSLCSELIVPFARKHVAVTKVTGAADNAAAAKKANESMNKIVAGPGTYQIDLKNLEKGATYEVAYSALDYAGDGRIVRFYFTVK